MAAREFDELLSAYLDGEVTPEERAAVEQRLEQSPPLRETLDELSEVGDLVRGLPRARPPIDLPERVVAAIKAKQPAAVSPNKGVPPHPRGLFGTFRRWQWMAAGSVVAAGLGWGLLLLNDGIGPAALHAPATENKAVAARDGLNAESLSGAVRPVAMNPGPVTEFFDSSSELESLTDLVRRSSEPLQPGDVLRILQNNGGEFQVVRYNVVDTSVMAGTLKTILARNGIDIITTDTPLDSAAVNGRRSQTRFVVMEGEPEQLAKTFREIHDEMPGADVVDFGTVTQAAEPAAPLGDERMLGTQLKSGAGQSEANRQEDAQGAPASKRTPETPALAATTPAPATPPPAPATIPAPAAAPAIAPAAPLGFGGGAMGGRGGGVASQDKADAMDRAKAVAAPAKPEGKVESDGSVVGKTPASPANNELNFSDPASKDAPAAQKRRIQDSDLKLKSRQSEARGVSTELDEQTGNAIVGQYLYNRAVPLSVSNSAAPQQNAPPAGSPAVSNEALQERKPANSYSLQDAKPQNDRRAFQTQQNAPAPSDPNVLNRKLTETEKQAAANSNSFENRRGRGFAIVIIETQTPEPAAEAPKK
jgi:hypothetical protein